MSLYTYEGHCDRVVDGDTYDLIVDLGFGVSKKIRIRLRGIDTPEKYGRVDTQAEKDHALDATMAAEDLLFSKWDGPRWSPLDLLVKTYKDRTGKYGRYLADIELPDGRDLASVLIAKGFEKRESYD